MEILRIGKFALKITLNAEETEKYKIFSDNDDSEAIKSRFTLLLQNAKEKVDFSFEGRKIFTEIYQGKDGGCEIFVSTISKEQEATQKPQNEDSHRAKQSISVYEFQNLEMLLKVSKRLNQIDYNGKCSVLYNHESKKYYIIFEDIFAKELRFAFLKEYSKQVKSSASGYIKEHCRDLLKKNTIKTLALLAN